MVDDAKRRASNALIEAFEDGFTMLEVLELAMDDANTSDKVADYLGLVHACYLAGGAER